MDRPPPTHTHSREHYPSPTPSPTPRPGLRLSLHLSNNKLDITSHLPPSTSSSSSSIPRHSSSSSSSSNSFSSSSSSSSFSSSSSSSSLTAIQAMAMTSLHPSKDLDAISYFSDPPFPRGSMSPSSKADHPRSSINTQKQKARISCSHVQPFSPPQHPHLPQEQARSPQHHRLSHPPSLKQHPRPLMSPSLPSPDSTDPPNSSSGQRELVGSPYSFLSSALPLSLPPSPTSPTHPPLPPSSTPSSSLPLSPSSLHSSFSPLSSFTRAFQTLDPGDQLVFLTHLVDTCSTSQLTFLTNIIAPKLKRDFLHDLPLELAHHILSFIDDPQSLARVSQVSRFWHQLVETEDWVWRAQCIKLFGPTSCSSLPSPKTHIAPPTSYLYTTSPTSLDAVSSTLKALSNASSQRSSAVSSVQSSTNTSPSWMNAREIPVVAASNLSTATVLSSMLLENQSSLSSVPSSSAASSSSFSSSSSTGIASSTGPGASSSTPRSHTFALSKGTSMTSKGLPTGNKVTLLGARISSGQGTSSTGDIATCDTENSGNNGTGTGNSHGNHRPLPKGALIQQHPHPPALYSAGATSYKAYFKRRFMIDRNWISGHHSLISYTTPETGVVTSLQFDHHHIVVGCDNSRIQIFETISGRLLRTLQGHAGGVWALEFIKGVGATGEKILVSGGCDREVRVWDMNTGRCRQVMSGHTGTIRCLKLHLKNLAITGSRDATLRVWDFMTGENKFLLQGHRDSVRCIEAHGNLLVSGSYDCTARVWSLVTGECLLVLQGHYQQIYSIAFNGEYIITGSLDSTCRLWSPTTGACLATLQGHTQLVGQLQLSGDHLMTGGGDGFMYLWDLKKFECQYRVQAHDQFMTSLCFDAKRIVTGGNDGAVKLWDRKTGKFIRLLTKTDAAIWRVAICEERIVMCMQKNGRTAMEIICFDSEAPVIDSFGTITTPTMGSATTPLASLASSPVAGAACGSRSGSGGVGMGGEVGVNGEWNLHMYQQQQQLQRRQQQQQQALHDQLQS